MKIKVGVIGASGYAGAELVRLLMKHPHVEVAAISSNQYQGESIASLYPGFAQVCELTFVSAQEVIDQSECIFASLPAGYSEPLAAECIRQNKKFIDLGADFRLEDSDTYQQWYGQAFQDKELHAQSVYGISELHKEQIQNSSLIGNPGCYPTSIELALYPVLQAGLIDVDTLILDSKSGVTGAGKGLSDATHFPRTNEAFAPYKVANHRHTPEIEQMLSEIAGQTVHVTFVPHLLPVNRGIISTIYCKTKQAIDLEQIHALYTKTYEEKPFVRICPLGQTADLKFVTYSNYCDISLHYDAHTQTLILVSCIDNMIKGAAGQAIQNMNIMYQWEETSGLDAIAPSF